MATSARTRGSKGVAQRAKYVVGSTLLDRRVLYSCKTSVLKMRRMRRCNRKPPDRGFLLLPVACSRETDAALSRLLEIRDQENDRPWMDEIFFVSNGGCLSWVTEIIGRRKESIDHSRPVCKSIGRGGQLETKGFPVAIQNQMKPLARTFDSKGKRTRRLAPIGLPETHSVPLDGGFL